MMSDRGTQMPARIEELLTAAVRAGHCPGAVAAWSIGNGPPESLAVGDEALLGSSRPTSVSTWYDLASLTKPMVGGTLMLMAATEHRLTLETRLDEVLPEARSTPLGKRTISQLMTHTSGLPAWAPMYALAHGRRERLLESLLEIPLESGAGERVCYSCLGYLVLGVVLERVLGAALDRLFEQRVALPLGLTGEVGFRPDITRIPVAAGASSSVIEEELTVAAGLDPRLVPARRHGDPDDGNARFLAGVAANAGLFGTASAVLRIAGMFLDGGGVLDPELAAIARRDHTAGLQQSRGLGWQIASSPGCSAGPWLSPAAFGHTGFTGTSVWVDPQRGLAIALLTNRLHPGARRVDLHPLRRTLHRLVAAECSSPRSGAW